MMVRPAFTKLDDLADISASNLRGIINTKAMESLGGVGVFLVFGGVLLLVNIWFVRQAYDSFFQPGIVIAPFEVIGQSGDGATGKTLANLLQASDRAGSSI